MFLFSLLTFNLSLGMWRGLLTNINKLTRFDEGVRVKVQVSVSQDWMLVIAATKLRYRLLSGVIFYLLIKQLTTWPGAALNRLYFPTSQINFICTAFNQGRSLTGLHKRLHYEKNI